MRLKPPSLQEDFLSVVIDLSALSDNRRRTFSLAERVSTSLHLFRTTLQVHNVRTSGKRSSVQQSAVKL